MKKTLLLLSFLGGIILSAHAQQLPNYGFNNWKTSCASTESFGSTEGMRQRPGVEPSEWNGSSVNQKVSGVEKQQELVYNDNNAVKMVNTYVGVNLIFTKIGSVAPGFITLGTPWVYASTKVKDCNGGTYGGINFSYKPDAITGRYKRTDTTGEESHIIAYLWNGTFTSKVGSVSSPSELRDNVEYAILGKTTPTTSGTLVASCDYAFNSTDGDWQTITVPLTYTEATSAPTMMNVVISGGNYWDRSSLKENTTLIADDIRFVYYSTLKTLSYDGASLNIPAVDGILDMSSVQYDAEKLAYTLNGQTATATTSYDEESGVLTIVVSNVDTDIDGQSSHTYYIQFAEPVHEHGNFKYEATGASLKVVCGDCGESLGTITMTSPSDLTYDGKEKVVSLSGSIAEMENPAVVYSSVEAPINVGTYTASITLGDATATIEFTIQAKDIEGATVGEFVAMTYTGKTQVPASIVTLEGFGEITGTWSEVTNVADKTTFTATGNYTGSIANVACGMQAKDIEGATVGEFVAMTYTGKAQVPAAIVTLEGFGEITGTWSEVTNVADKTAFTANGNYTGSIANVACSMQAKGIEGATVGEFVAMTYTGKPQVPVAIVTLEGFGEITGTWSEVTNVADKTTFTATGNYCGTLQAEVGMAPIEAESLEVVGAVDSCDYTGEAIELELAVKNGEITLYEDVDYTIAYENNVSVGTATITIAMKGNYSGTIILTFEIIDTTNITDIHSPKGTIEYYDLCGRRVTQPIKGRIYIANGKKVIL